MRWTFVALVTLAVALSAAQPAGAAPATIAATLQLRGHLPELGSQPTMRVFQTQSAYDSFRSSLGDANVFPPASSLFMSFSKDLLVLYARGVDTGGRCLRTGGTATVDGDTATLDLLWESGTCGAPDTARHPFALISLSRTTADGSAWVPQTRSVCGAPPGVDMRACAPLTAGVATPPPTPAATVPATPSLAASSPSPSVTPSPAPTPSPTPSTPPSATPSATPAVTLAAPTPSRSSEPSARPIPPAPDGTVNYLFWAAFGLIVALVVVAAILARSPRS